ncbi:MAG: GNAT family N-acetyltransferase [Acidimicrobiales bacterium]
MYPVVIEAERIALRELGSQDAESLLKITADPQTTRFMALGQLTRHEAESYLGQLLDAATDAARHIYALAILNRDDQQVIGLSQLSIESFTHRRAELGYLLSSEHWGHGYGREATAALTSFGFDHLGLQRIYAVSTADNIASQRLLESLDFRFEGELQDHLLIDGTWTSGQLFARTNQSC